MLIVWLFSQVAAGVHGQLEDGAMVLFRARVVCHYVSAASQSFAFVAGVLLRLEFLDHQKHT